MIRVERRKYNKIIIKYSQMEPMLALDNHLGLNKPNQTKPNQIKSQKENLNKKNKNKQKLKRTRKKIKKNKSTKIPMTNERHY